MTEISDLHRRWSKHADYKDAYDAIDEEFDLARALIEVRTAAGLSQSQLTKKTILGFLGAGGMPDRFATCRARARSTRIRRIICAATPRNCARFCQTARSCSTSRM